MYLFDLSGRTPGSYHYIFRPPTSYEQLSPKLTSPLATSRASPVILSEAPVVEILSRMRGGADVVALLCDLRFNERTLSILLRDLTMRDVENFAAGVVESLPRPLDLQSLPSFVRTDFAHFRVFSVFFLLFI